LEVYRKFTESFKKNLSKKNVSTSTGTKWYSKASVVMLVLLLRVKHLNVMHVCICTGDLITRFWLIIIIILLSFI
jgi:hypothetical protein